MAHSLHLKRAFILALVLAAATGCGHKYVIKSDPQEASVYLNETLVGKTPIEIPVGDLPDTANIRLRVAKDGYATFNGMIPGPSMTTLKSEVSVALNKGMDETDKVNRNMGLIINAQKLVTLRKYADAMKLADQALAENPRYVYAQTLKASIYFLSNDFNNAVTEFQKVLEIEPTNTEAVRMINYLKTTGGARLPASATMEKKKP